MPKKRADGRYEIKVKISRAGEPRKYVAVYGKTLRQAREKAEEMKSTLFQPKTEVTVAEAIDYWLEQKAKVLRPQSLRNYKTAVGPVVDAIGTRPISEVSVDDVRQLHNKVAEVSVVQANRMAARMKGVYGDAIVRGIIKENPWAYVTLQKHDKAEKRALTDAEMDAVEAADLNPWERAYISVLRYTGMRKGEALALDVDDLQFGMGIVSVNKTNVDGRIGPPKTKSSNRRIPMPDPLVKTLKEYLSEYHPGEGLLFPNTLGRPMSFSSFSPIWKRIAAAIYGDSPPADFTPHIFRHTYASTLVKNHVPPTTAQLLLGHRSLSTTMNVYTHLGWQDIDAEQINNIFRVG